MDLCLCGPCIPEEAMVVEVTVVVREVAERVVGREAATAAAATDWMASSVAWEETVEVVKEED